MDSINLIQDRLKLHQSLIESILLDKSFVSKIAETAKFLCDTFKTGGKVFFCGNGGSAADAQHLAAEFSGKFYLDRPGLPAEALHCNSSYMTAVANDYSFELTYARLIEGQARKGDVLAGLSTSGNSANIVKTFESCRKKGIKTIAFTGEGGGKLRSLADFLIEVPSSDTPRIQEAHITIGHILCEIVESTLFGKS
jgi:D-sedoheptulose 7-phosphate isomerase